MIIVTISIIMTNRDDNSVNGGVAVLQRPDKGQHINPGFHDKRGEFEDTFSLEPSFRESITFLPLGIHRLALCLMPCNGVMGPWGYAVNPRKRMLHSATDCFLTK